MYQAEGIYQCTAHTRGGKLPSLTYKRAPTESAIEWLLLLLLKILTGSEEMNKPGMNCYHIERNQLKSSHTPNYVKYQTEKLTMTQAR